MRTKSKIKVKVVILLSALIMLFGGAYVFSRLLFDDHKTILFLSSTIDKTVIEVLTEAQVPQSSVKRNVVRKEKNDAAWDQVELVVQLTETDSLSHIQDELKKALLLPGVSLQKVENSSKDYRKSHLSVFFHELLLYQVLFQQEVPPVESTMAAAPAAVDEQEDEMPKIALIVDDIGYDLERAMEIINLRRPLTFSIFPQLLYSRHIAESAHKMGHEIMMHLPMEPDENWKRNPGLILQDMDRDQLQWMLETDLKSIPHVSGVNNHQGSKMTRDEAAMELVMDYLRRKDLYFVDSRTTSESVAFEVAKQLGLKAAENDVFLDNEKDVDYIKERFELLMEKAEENGEAIGICHVHPVTVKVLREMLPLIEKRGFKLVYVSEIVR